MPSFPVIPSNANSRRLFGLWESNGIERSGWHLTPFSGGFSECSGGNVFCAHRITKCESEKGFERGLKWHTPRTSCIYFQVDGVSAVYIELF